MAISVAFCSKIIPSALSKKSFFFGKPNKLCYNSQKNSNVLRNLTVSVALYSKIATSSRFRKSTFFWKTFFFKTSQFFWGFWEILLIASHSTAYFLPPAIFETFKFSLENASFFRKKPTFLRVLRNLTLPFAFDIQLANFKCFQKIQFFSEKNIWFFRIQSLNVSRNLTNSVVSAASLLPLALFKNSHFFSKNPLTFSEKNYKRFEKTYYFLPFLQQTWYL